MFPKKERTSFKDFKLLKEAARFETSAFFVRFKKAGTLKVGVVIPKKNIKLATARNRIKRQILHLIKSTLKSKTGIYVIQLKPGIKTISKEDIDKLIVLLEKID